MKSAIYVSAEDRADMLRAAQFLSPTEDGYGMDTEEADRIAAVLRRLAGSAAGVGPSAPPTYFCNKCGYHGPVQTGHQRPNGSGECGYMAVLIAGVGPSAPPTYFCNKCGYHGPVQTGHQRPNGSGECGYMAVLIAGVRVESTPLADFIRNATPEEKAKVYGEIMDEVGRQQRAVIDGVQTPDGEQR